ncbi:MAG: ATP-dependent Clp protease adapter ClpS [Verrucomicrobiales bacterium]|nr:ATP-dependent Clp protease adapter ClpS [Verrucomicrobiales bacterium]
MMSATELEEWTAVETSDELSTPWAVVVYDDPVNLMSFVQLVFRRVFGYSDEKSMALMLEVHHDGRSVVWSGERERAEMYVQQLQSYQLLAAMEKAD